MRIVHVITRLIVGGAQENTLASLVGLRAHPDVAVRLVSGPTLGPEGSLEPIAQAIPGLLTLVPSLVRPIRPWHDLRALVALTRLFHSWAPQIVHTHSGKAGFLGRWAAHRARVPSVVHTIHGPSFGPFQGALANTALRAAERFAGRLTHHFVVVADAMTRQYLNAGIGRADQYTRILSGFDLDPFLDARNNPAVRARLGLPADAFVVGKIARLFKLKGHQDLIAAAPALVREIPQIRFLLVGDGPLRSHLETEVRRRELSDRFRFVGLVRPTEIPELVGVMDVLVHLSRREGLARALPQALAAGKPIVAYDCDGAREVCLEGRTGYLIPMGHLDVLCDRVRRLAAAPESRIELGNRGRELARQYFPVHRMVEELYGLYQRLLA